MARISLLETVMDEQAKAVEMTISIKDLNAQTAKMIIKAINENSGSCKILINIINPETNNRVKLVSGKQRVMISRISKALAQIPKVSFTIKK